MQICGRERNKVLLIRKDIKMMVRNIIVVRLIKIERMIVINMKVF